MDDRPERSQPEPPGEDERALLVVAPAHPPVITPEVARVLLRILRHVRDNQP
jgi:hypothetical protein